MNLKKIIQISLPIIIFQFMLQILPFMTDRELLLNVYVWIFPVFAIIYFFLLIPKKIVQLAHQQPIVFLGWLALFIFVGEYVMEVTLIGLLSGNYLSQTLIHGFVVAAIATVLSAIVIVITHYQQRRLFKTYPQA